MTRQPLMFVHKDAVENAKKMYPHWDVRPHPLDVPDEEARDIVMWPCGEESMSWPVMLSQEVIK